MTYPPVRRHAPFPLGWGLVLALLLLLLGKYVNSPRHEVGSYLLEVSWRNEPAVAGEPNSLHLAVRPKTADDVKGELEEGVLRSLEKTLRAEVIVGEEHIPLPLRPVPGEAGVYEAAFTPALPGRYLLHITGELGSLRLDETFDARWGDFAPVQGVGTPLLNRLSQATAEGQGENTASQQGRSWHSLAGAAFVGIVLGLMVAGMALLRKR